MFIWRKRPKKTDRTRSRKYRAGLAAKNRKRKVRTSGLPH